MLKVGDKAPDFVLEDDQGQPISNLIPREAEALNAERPDLADDLRRHLTAAVAACRSGVRRIHLLRRATDGALLRGVRFDRNGVRTQSLVMRSRSGTVRMIDARHSVSKLREFAAIDY